MSSKIPMFSKVLALAIAGAASLAAFGASAPALAQDLSLTRTCAFRDGPRAGQTIDYTGSPGAAPVRIGARCADMQGSSGVAIAQASGREQSHRFYTSPGAPTGWGPSGLLNSGFSLTCRLDTGPRAGSSVNFSGTLGAQPLRAGTPCSDGSSQGVAVGPGQ
jgi:hypothetical protein